MKEREKGGEKEGEGGGERENIRKPHADGIYVVLGQHHTSRRGLRQGPHTVRKNSPQERSRCEPSRRSKSRSPLLQARVARFTIHPPPTQLGRKPIDYAVERGNNELVSELKNAGA